jgi:predicted short-subunit dehydrogenase-like oxidoreductase (DUF2520 family)
MNKKELAVGFIGIGVLGKGLALALAAQGYLVVAAHSRRPSSAQWLADRVPTCRVYASAQEVADAADLVFITTPDSVIGGVVTAVDWRPDQGVVHCCGTASIELLQPAAHQGAVTGAFHPFQTFAGLDDPQEAVSRLAGVTFAVDAQGWLSNFLCHLARELGGRALSIRPQDRPLYHAAAVLSCGYLVALLQAAVALWEETGVSRQEAIEAIYPLSRVTLENVAKCGIEASITGPVVRGDVATTQSHLEALSQRLPGLLPLYRALTEASFPLAVGRGVSPAQLAAMRGLLDHYPRHNNYSTMTSPNPGETEERRSGRCAG